eukprot:2043777-Rhodomonas_salina.1
MSGTDLGSAATRLLQRRSAVEWVAHHPSRTSIILRCPALKSLELAYPCGVQCPTAGNDTAHHDPALRSVVDTAGTLLSGVLVQAYADFPHLVCMTGLSCQSALLERRGQCMRRWGTWE